MLSFEIPKLSTDPTCKRVSYCVEDSPPSRLPPHDRSLSLNPLSLFTSFIFCPFEEIGFFFLYLVSSTSVYKLFCGGCSTFIRSFDEFVGEKVVSPS